MSASDLKIILLTIGFAALYINIRARALNKNIRGALQAALLVAAVSMIAIVPAWVYSRPDAAFRFDAATGLSARAIAPEAHGLNRAFIFTFDNPRNSRILGRIFDLHGTLVAGMAAHPSLDASRQRFWDGTVNGVFAAPGVYIYRIEAEEKVFAGTLGVNAPARPQALTAAFTFDPSSGVSNRFITPNGDGLNDFAVFSFSNPRDAEVVGRIFDLRGAQVAEMSAHSTLNARFNKVWDGKSNGAPAAPGIYIYRIEAENRAFTGTVTVIR